ncbi:hypothetical protein CARN8_580004 [mine drainage metagenome]|uniref:Uncharacterized protein n=1 Tax=mine drainage metagenome TaxID=410659 RepID=A0A3P3ZR95_9ZZZZ
MVNSASTHKPFSLRTKSDMNHL